MREIAAFIMAGRWRALIAAGGFGLLGVFFLPLLLLSAAAVGLVTLRRGAREGGITMLGAACLVGSAFWLLPARPGFAFPLVFALWPPVWVGALVLRHTFSQGVSLTVVGMLIWGYVAAMHALTGDVVGFWRAWLEQAIANVPGATVEGFDYEGTLRLMNGLVAMVYGLSVFASLLLARWWQAILYYPGGFQSEFCELRTPRWLLPVLVAVLWLAGYWSRVLLADLLLSAMAVYLFQGLAVVHRIVSVRNLSGFWLVPPYGLLVLMPQYAVVGLALLGALDSLFDLRHRAGT
ncbi:MAG: hypothetical protein N3A55_01920 [Methylohalobius sp.]|nr:hypothetical protein [Methylohalobius sp.]